MMSLRVMARCDHEFKTHRALASDGSCVSDSRSPTSTGSASARPRVNTGLDQYRMTGPKTNPARCPIRDQPANGLPVRNGPGFCSKGAPSLYSAASR